MRGKNKNTRKGHIWVCDGYFYERIETKWGVVGKGYLLHMVWGWGKRANGYFKVDSKFTHYNGYGPTDEEKLWNELYEDRVQHIDLKFVGGITPKI